MLLSARKWASLASFLGTTNKNVQRSTERNWENLRDDDEGCSGTAKCSDIRQFVANPHKFGQLPRASMVESFLSQFFVFGMGGGRLSGLDFTRNVCTLLILRMLQVPNNFRFTNSIWTTVVSKINLALHEVRKAWRCTDPKPV